MKNLLWVLLFSLLLTSCVGTIKLRATYEVLQYQSFDVDPEGQVVNYVAVIKIGEEFYSARLDSNFKLMYIDRRLERTTSKK